MQKAQEYMKVIDSYVHIYTKKYIARPPSIAVPLVLSLIEAESDWDSMAVSSKGAIGLMQILPETGKWMAARLEIPFQKERLFEVEYNIMLGCAYLGYLLKITNGNLWRAIYLYGGMNSKLADQVYNNISSHNK